MGSFGMYDSDKGLEKFGEWVRPHPHTYISQNEKPGGEGKITCKNDYAKFTYLWDWQTDEMFCRVTANKRIKDTVLCDQKFRGLDQLLI